MGQTGAAGDRLKESKEKEEVIQKLSQKNEELGILRDPDEKLSTTFNKDAFSELVQNSEYVPTINTLQDWQKEILSVLIRKHGDDCKAMSKDIKINSWQWTKAQIKRMINLLEIS